MDARAQLVSLGRAARSDAKIGVRQPLPRAIALLAAGEALRDDVVQEIDDELNVKRLEVVTTLEGLLSYRVVPNFRALGPRLGKLVNRVKALLADVDGGEVRRAFDEHGRFDLDVDGETVTLEPGDVEIRAEQHDDLTLAQDGRTRSRSTSPSTTTSAPKARRASSSGRSTTCARRSASRSATASACATTRATTSARSWNDTATGS